MKLQIALYVPDPTTGGFRLDRSRLDHPTSRLKPLDPAEAILDLTKLTEGRLGPVPNNRIWLDITKWVTSAECSERHRSDSPALPPEPGHATIVARDMPDLLELGTTVNTRLRITHEGYLVWAGWVSDWFTEWHASGSATTTIVADDLAAILGRTQRYGARHPSPESLNRRLSRLAESSPVPISTVGDTDPLIITQTALESSLLAHMAMAAATTQRYLRINTSTNRITAPTPSDSTVLLRYSDTGHSGWAYGAMYSCTVATSDTSTALAVTSHEIGPDGNATHTTTEVIDPTAVLVRGKRTAAIDISAPISLAPELARLLPPYDAGPTITGLTIPGDLNARHGFHHSIRTAWLEPLDLIEVTRLGATYTVRVASVTHRWDIDPRHLGTFSPIRHTVHLTTTRKAR